MLFRSREIDALARAAGKDRKEIRRLLDRSGQVTSLAGDIIRSKALDFLVESAEVTSSGSQPASPEPSQTQGEQDE